MLSCSALLAGPAAITASAQGPDVLVLGSDDTAWSADVVTRLLGTGLFGSVTSADGRVFTPTAAELSAYDAVLTWANYGYASAVLLGERLADYVDVGGGVVVATFTNCEISSTFYLGGRWRTGGNYRVILGETGCHVGTASLGNVHLPNHPVMTGVSTFDGGAAYRANSTILAPLAQSVADWTDGSVLVALHGTMPNRVDLNLFPPSAAIQSGGWVVGTDGARLMANALLQAATGASNLTHYCSGDGTAAACPCGNSGAAGNGCASSVSPGGARLTGSGFARLSNDTLVLHGSSMPQSFALYYQGTTRTAGGLGIVFGDGLRCAGGAIVRLKTVSNVGGASHVPLPGDPTISARGLVTTPGTRTYQVWYRNAALFCTPVTFNMTNGVEVAWGS